MNILPGRSRAGWHSAKGLPQRSYVEEPSIHSTRMQGLTASYRRQLLVKPKVPSKTDGFGPAIAIGK